MPWPLAFAALVTVGVSAYARLFRRLRECHPEEYRRLGSPVLLNTSLRRSLAVQRFLRGRRDRSIGDPELQRLCAFIRVLNPVYGCFLLAWVAVLMAGLRSGP